MSGRSARAGVGRLSTDMLLRGRHSARGTRDHLHPAGLDPYPPAVSVRFGAHRGADIRALIKQFPWRRYRLVQRPLLAAQRPSPGVGWPTRTLGRSESSALPRNSQSDQRDRTVSRLLLRRRRGGRECFNFREHGIERGTRHKFATKDDGADRGAVVDVRQRIAV
jgi:hypothetical protein